MGVGRRESPWGIHSIRVLTSPTPSTLSESFKTPKLFCLCFAWGMFRFLPKVKAETKGRRRRTERNNVKRNGDILLGVGYVFRDRRMEMWESLRYCCVYSRNRRNVNVT